MLKKVITVWTERRYLWDQNDKKFMGFFLDRGMYVCLESGFCCWVISGSIICDYVYPISKVCYFLDNSIQIITIVSAWNLPRQHVWVHLFKYLVRKMGWLYWITKKNNNYME